MPTPPSNIARAEISILPTPPPAAQLLEVTPTPTSSPTPFPTALPFPSFQRSYGTPIPSTSLVICTPQGDFIDCYDELLAMSFSYPTFMGALSHTTLRQGGWSGYFYEYAFDSDANLIGAGGRSSDFSEGREPIQTDQSGFNGRTADEVCAARQADQICDVIHPNTVFLVSFPRPEWFCQDYTLYAPPYGMVIVDLPHHPLIQGFSFINSFASQNLDDMFRFAWSDEHTLWTNDQKLCNPEIAKDFKRQMDQLRLDLKAGTSENDIQSRYDAMIELAKSIHSPYIDTQL